MRAPNSSLNKIRKDGILMEKRKQIGQGVFAVEGSFKWYKDDQYDLVITYGLRKGNVFVDLKGLNVNYGIFANEMVALPPQQLKAKDDTIINYVKSQITLATE